MPHHYHCLRFACHHAREYASSCLTSKLDQTDGMAWHGMSTDFAHGVKIPFKTTSPVYMSFLASCKDLSAAASLTLTGEGLLWKVPKALVTRATFAWTHWEPTEECLPCFVVRIAL